jgi:hypothetical protein
MQSWERILRFAWHSAGSAPILRVLDDSASIDVTPSVMSGPDVRAVRRSLRSGTTFGIGRCEAAWNDVYAIYRLRQGCNCGPADRSVRP